MKGQKIVIQSEPKGVRIEGTIVGTPKPGTLMMPQRGPLVNGRMTWIPLAPTADGAISPSPLVAVLEEDYLQGKTVNDAYVSGTRGMIYCPLSGEEVNVLVTEPGTGTGPGFWQPGTGLMVSQANPGLLKPVSGSPASVPFITSDYTSEGPAGATTILLCAVCTGSA